MRYVIHRGAWHHPHPPFQNPSSVHGSIPKHVSEASPAKRPCPWHEPRWSIRYLLLMGKQRQQPNASKTHPARVQGRRLDPISSRKTPGDFAGAPWPFQLAGFRSLQSALIFLGRQAVKSHCIVHSWYIARTACSHRPIHQLPRDAGREEAPTVPKAAAKELMHLGQLDPSLPAADARPRPRSVVASSDKPFCQHTGPRLLLAF